MSGAVWLASLAGAVMVARATTGHSTATRQAPGPAATPGFQHARDALAAAMADGVWSEADRDALRAAVRTLAPDESHALYAQLLPRINAQALRVDLDGPPI